MLIQHKRTGEFYKVTYWQILDVSAQTLSMNYFQKPEDLEAEINRTFAKRRGDQFQLRERVEIREKTLRLVCGSDNVWTEAYRVEADCSETIATLKWTGRRFEVL